MAKVLVVDDEKLIVRNQVQFRAGRYGSGLCVRRERGYPDG